MPDIIKDLFLIATGVFLIWFARGEIRGNSWLAYETGWPNAHRFMMGAGALAVLIGAIFLIVDSLQLLLWIIIVVAGAFLFWKFVLKPGARR